MFDHICLYVNDLPASKTFYTTLLASLNYKILMTIDNGSGIHGYGKCQPQFWLAPFSQEKEMPCSGPIHLAFTARNRAQVDAFYAAGLKAGGKSNGPPGVRKDYHRFYYGAFLFDLDGNNVECVCHMPPALTWVTSWPVIFAGVGMFPESLDTDARNGCWGIGEVF